MIERPKHLSPRADRTRPERPQPVIPDHKLFHRIGEGAYGDVWLARNVLGAYRAVKVVYRNDFRDERPYEREYRGIERFEPISRTHEGFVAVLQVGRGPDDDYFYYVMELADSADVALSEQEVDRDAATPADAGSPSVESGQGESPPSDRPRDRVSPEVYVPHTLALDLRRDGCLRVDECVRLGISMTLALGHLHRHGLIHRDVKPSNIIFVNGLPKLADIGLVAPATEAHSLVGTEGFMPPEGPTSPQADVYGLGKVLYEASMGRDRRDFPEPFTTLRQGSDADALMELNAVVLKACAPEARERYSSTEEMHVDLALLHGGKSVKRKRALERRVKVLARLGGGAALVALLAIGGWFSEQWLRKAETRERERAERMVNHLERQRVQEMFAADQAPGALAKLARLLRQAPTDRAVAERIMAALSNRDWALPMARLAHADDVGCLRLTADGLRAVTSSEDRTARVWDVNTGRPIGQPMWHDTGVQYVDISADGALVVTAAGANLRVWDARTGEPVSDSFTQTNRISLVRFSPDATRLLVLLMTEWPPAPWTGHRVLLLDARTGEQLGPPLEHDGPITSAEFSPEGDKVVTASWQGGPVRVWDAYTALPLRAGPPHYSGFWIARFSPDGRKVFSGGSPGIAWIWDAETGDRRVDLIGHSHVVLCADFSPDGSRLITGSSDRTVRIWDAKTGKLLMGPWEHAFGVRHVAFSRDGQQAIAVSWDGSWRWRHADTGQVVAEKRYIGTSPVWNPDVHQNGNRLVMRDGDEPVVWILDARRGQAAPGVLEHEGFVVFARFSRDGSRLVTTADIDTNTGHITRTSAGRKGESEGRSARVWEVPAGVAVTARLEHDDGVRCADFSPDGARLVTGSRDRTARVWETETGKLELALQHDRPVRSALFSPDGNRVFTSGWMHDGWLWNAATGQRTQRLDGPKAPEDEVPRRQRATRIYGPVRSADMSPDGKRVVTCSRSRGARIWSTEDGKLVSHVPVTNEVWTARFGPTGRHLAVVEVNSVQVWDVRAGQPVTQLMPHEDKINSVAFSPDGTRLVTASCDRTARIWDARTGEQLTEALRHQGEVLHAEFSPDGHRVVTASWWDDAAFLWDARTGLPLSEPLRHDDWVTYATFSPDSRWVVTTSCDRTAKIWEVPMAEGPIPTWLADLAEAVGGQRIDDRNVPGSVPMEELWQLRTRLLASTETDDYTRWAKWFFSDRATRSRSPNSSVMVGDGAGE